MGQNIDRIVLDVARDHYFDTWTEGWMEKDVASLFCNTHPVLLVLKQALHHSADLVKI